MMINYTYTDQGRQMMILDLGAPVSIAGVPWMRQYLAGFGLEIENMKSVSCNQPFVFGPSRRYVSKSLIELPILVTRMDGREDVLQQKARMMVPTLVLKAHFSNESMIFVLLYQSCPRTQNIILSKQKLPARMNLL